MLFNSAHYFIFAPIVILLYFIFPKKFQMPWLFIVSLYFYAIFRVPFLLLLIFSFIVTKLAVDAMERTDKKIAKIFWLNVSIWSNLGLLFVFKYLDFTISAWNSLFGLKPCDPSFVSSLGIILPMGISFFTLQAVSYAVDVFRGVVQPAKSIFHFGLFISFFPQLVAGPILRASDVLTQFLEPKEFQKENLTKGLKQLFWGVFKKTFIADPVSYVIDPVFGDPTQYSGVAIWASGILFGVQVYCDFSGYSDIAIGTARILGFHIPKNFDRPFLSGTLGELWRRWHISFSTWLREYVYIFLGGSKRGEVITYINLFITTFVSGIWHGADWTYIIWGAAHAGAMVIERFAFKFKAVKNAWDSVPRAIQPIYPIFVFVVAIFFFRARPTEAFPNALDISFLMLGRAFGFAEGQMFDVPVSLISVIAFLLFVDIVQNNKEDYFDFITDRPVFLYTICSVMYITAFLIYSVTVSSPFLYFQF
ncbi:MBOAT family O-acyltransferase [Leptospira ilyithenensis]|uniref:MBOAT family protein n=1 Tax=Leptospira ilyithenensis TaxID=2484901 RepID=A0A4R9LNH6_9LEPT|nr:MBOAT family O-acyltransferase [Leptospira ilyithenensis]TGN10254.1 MBOAT family protein [Leptospira ilyithenensis]